MSVQRTILLTAASPHGRADLCVAADVPVFQLIPSLLVATGASSAPVASDDGAERARWRLLAEDGRLLSPRATLAGAGVADGETLSLRPDMTAEVAR